MSVKTLLTFLSYGVWAIVTFICLKKYSAKYHDDLTRFAYVTFFITALNSTMGFTDIIQEDIMASLKVLLEILQESLALPCLTTEVWLKKNISKKEVAWMHTGLGLIPTYIFLFQHYTRQDLIDFSLITNVLSLAGVGLAYKDVFSLCSAISIFSAYCVFHQRNHQFVPDEDVARQLFNISMAVFTFSGYKAVI